MPSLHPLTTPEPLRLQIDVEADGGTLVHDEQTALLQQELTQMRIRRIGHRSGGPAAPGKRGSLVVELGPGVLGSLVQATHAWLRRSRAKSIRVRIGDDELVIEDAPVELQRTPISAFVERHA